MDNRAYFDLVELIEQQGQIIKEQSNTIAKLINENAEMESIINEIIRSGYSE